MLMPDETFSALTTDQLSKLEAIFGVTLPEFYRKFCQAYPRRFTEPTLRKESIAEREIVADYEQLIELNQSVRNPDLWFFGEHPWPSHFFVIGDDGYGDHYFIDTRGEHPGILFQDQYIWDIECKADSLHELAVQIEENIADAYGD